MSAPSFPSLPPELRARVIEAARREAIPTRAVGSRRRTRAVAMGFGALLAMLAILGPRPLGRPDGYILAVVVAWLPIAAAATWAGVSQGRSMLGRPAAWLVGVIARTPVVMMAVWACVALAWPSVLHDASGPKQHISSATS